VNHKKDASGNKERKKKWLAFTSSGISVMEREKRVSLPHFLLSGRNTPKEREKEKVAPPPLYVNLKGKGSGVLHTQLEPYVRTAGEGGERKKEKGKKRTNSNCLSTSEEKENSFFNISSAVGGLGKKN